MAGMSLLPRLPAALLLLALPGCVYVQEPAYAPLAYAPAVGPNAGTGAAIGALAGGLIGSAAAGRHDRGTGILGGAAAGALLGGLVGSGLDRQEEDAARAQPPPVAQGYATPDPYRTVPPPAPYGAPKAWPQEPGWRSW